MSVNRISALWAMFKNANTAAQTRVEFENIKKEEKHFTNLAARIRASAIAQHNGRADEGNATAVHDALHRDQVQQVRNNVRQAFTNGLAVVDKKITAAEIRLQGARHPDRSCLDLPFDGFGPVGQREKERRRGIMLTGEATTLRCNRLAQSLPPEALAFELQKQIAEGNVDAVGSLLDAAVVRWKSKLPDSIQVIHDDLITRDWFKEHEMANEIRGLRELREEIQRELDSRPPQLSDEELEELKMIGAAVVPHFAESWD